MQVKAYTFEQKKKKKKRKKNDQELSQSQTTDQLTTPRGKAWTQTPTATRQQKHTNTYNGSTFKQQNHRLIMGSSQSHVVGIDIFYPAESSP